MSVVKPFKQAAVSVPAENTSHGVVGKIVNITEDGIALVDFPGCTSGPIAARSVLDNPQEVARRALPIQVLLVFEQGDQQKPIISGVLNNRAFLPPSEPSVHELAGLETNNSGHVEVDGKRMTFDAKEEILLRCGKSSILLRRDGKVVIKGTNLISRSSAANKIKGSSVSIN